MIVITAHGRLAHQPEVRMLKQTSVCEFRLLSNRYARGAEHTEAVTFFCYGEEAEAFCERVEKGQLISATGTQETDRWTDASGQERIRVKYKLTWWEAGPRPTRARLQDRAPDGRHPPAAAPTPRCASSSAAPAGQRRPNASQADEAPAGPGLV